MLEELSIWWAGDHTDEFCTTCVGSPGGAAWYGMAPPLGPPCWWTSLPCTLGQDEGFLPEMPAFQMRTQHFMELPNQRMGSSSFWSRRTTSWPWVRMKPAVWKYHLLGKPYLVFINVSKFYSAKKWPDQNCLNCVTFSI